MPHQEPSPTPITLSWRTDWKWFEIRFMPGMKREVKKTPNMGYSFFAATGC